METAKNNSALTMTNSPHTHCEGRICSLAAGSNMIYIGTVAGDILVSKKSDGQILQEKRWK
jgi:hypothetical protein